MAESAKIEARLGEELRLALTRYMRAKHIDNASVILKSALGQFLEREGYLMEEPTRTTDAPDATPPTPRKPVNYRKEKKK